MYQHTKLSVEDWSEEVEEPLRKVEEIKGNLLK